MRYLLFLSILPPSSVFHFLALSSSYLPYVWNEPGSSSGSTVFDQPYPLHPALPPIHLPHLPHLYYYHHLDPNPFLSALALGSDVCRHSCILYLFILGDMLKCC
ncbi:hypothetical protein BDW67DRAFT_103940 [Aspergillus spinulosporus]